MRKLWLVVALLVSASGGVLAKNVIVPGPGTPFQNAIDAAPENTTLFVFSGTYPETVTVTKRLRLVHARDAGPAPEIAAGCGSATALTIAADGVSVEGLHVCGGSFFTIDIQNRDHVKLKARDAMPRARSVGRRLYVFGQR